MKITWSVFPKFYKDLSLPELAALVRDAGLDTTNITIRDGYWVTQGNLAAETKAFVEAMEKEGLKIHFATTGFSAKDLVRDDSARPALEACRRDAGPGQSDE